MLVQINTDSHIKVDTELAQRVETTVRDALARFAPQVTRVEMYLSDENGELKSGPKDKRCRLEARVAGMPPISVSHHAPTLEQGIDGAVSKLTRSLDSARGRLQSH